MAARIHRRVSLLYERDLNMNMKLLLKLATIIYGALTALLFCRATQADIIFSIDVDPDTPGIQDMRTVFASATFQATFLLELTGTSTLDSYRTSVQFDSAGFANPIGMTTPVPNYSPQVGTLFLMFDVIGPFEASADLIGQGFTAPSGPFVIGTIGFTAKNSIGSFSIQPIEVTLLDGSFDNNFNQLTPVFNGATITITAVPEPSSLSIIGVVFCGCYIFRRVRRSQNPTLHDLKEKS